jgi:hypothetical protein
VKPPPQSTATAPCALCLRPERLLVSHLIPAGFYRLLRDDGKKNPNPIVVGQEVSLQTAVQVEAPLLCRECEQRLNNGGERWVLQNCFRSAEGFKLQDVLTAANPLHRRRDSVIYAGVQIAGVNMDALAYFAASVIWRAAAHTWKYHDSREQLSLGPYYDAFRLYLLGRQEFPTSAALWINVWLTPINLCVMPRTLPANGYRHHNFTVPGISFHLFVGQRIPVGARFACAVRSPERMIILSDSMNGPMLAGIARMVTGSRPKGSLRDD